MLNGRILKNFIQPKVEAYQFPEADDAAPQETEDLRESFQDELFLDREDGDAIPGAPPVGSGFPRKAAFVNFDDEIEAQVKAAAHAKEADADIEAETESSAEPEGSPSENPVSFAAIQAEAILSAARTEAENIHADALAQAERIQAGITAQAQEEAEQLQEAARLTGYQEGYSQGIAAAAEEIQSQREQQAAAMEKELQQFLENVALAHDELMDNTKEDMRDLAIGVAEKVVRVSLKSSSGIIARMIQDATSKLKRREWVHIYVAGCDAKGIAQITPRLTRALSALSDHIKIIPMADEESGTCIIETPDTIIDASASVQMANIRNLVQDIPPDDQPASRQFGRRLSDR